jgi:hypothetical protein
MSIFGSHSYSIRESRFEALAQRRITAHMPIAAPEGASGCAALRRAAPPHDLSAPSASGQGHIRAIRYAQLHKSAQDTGNTFCLATSVTHSSGDHRLLDIPYEVQYIVLY